MTLLFNNGTAEVRILKDGTTYTRQNLPYFFNSISSVDVSVGAGFVASIKLTLTPSFKDGLDILRSGLLGVGLGKVGQKPERVNEGDGLSTKTSKSAAGTVASPLASQAERAPTIKSTAGLVQVRFLYPQNDNDNSAAQTPWFAGVMVRPDVNISGASIDITINAVSSANFLNIIQGAFTFKNVSALSVINKLAKPIDMEVTFDKNDTETKALLENKKISGAINEPRLQAIKNILYRLDCFWETSSGEEGQPKAQLRVRSRTKIGTGDIEFTFVMFSQIDPTNNVIPIYDLSLSSTGPLFITGGAFGSFQRCLLEKDKKSKNVERSGKDIDGVNFSNAGLGGGNLVEGELLEGGATGLTDISDKELTGSSLTPAVKRDDGDNFDEITTATARGVFFGPKYNLTLPGLPRLRPLSLNQIIIANKITGISGVGFVKKINHVLDSGGWKTMCEFTQTGGLGTGDSLANFSNVDVQEPPRNTGFYFKAIVVIGVIWMSAELIANLIDEIRDFGFEKVFRRYYGIYRAEVTDTTDKDHRGKIEVKIPDLFGEDPLPNMALPKDFRLGPGKGEFFPPDTGDFCWIEFENGDPRFPVYSGGWYAESELPEEFEYDSTDKPLVKGFVGRGGQKMLFKETPDAEQWTFRTQGGHFFVLDDTVDAEGIFLIHKTGAQIQLDKNGSIKVLAQNGSFINLDSNPDEEDPAVTVMFEEGAYASVGKDIKLSDSSGENFATINDKGVTLNAAAGAIINGNSLGVSVGTVDIKDTTKAGLKIANGQVALGNVTVEVVDTIIKIIDALTDGSPLVTTGTGPSSGLLPPALVNLTLLKTLLTPLKGSL